MEGKTVLVSFSETADKPLTDLVPDPLHTQLLGPHPAPRSPSCVTTCLPPLLWPHLPQTPHPLWVRAVGAGARRGGALSQALRWLL